MEYNDFVVSVDQEKPGTSWEERLLRRPMVFISAAFGSGISAAFFVQMQIGIWIIAGIAAAAGMCWLLMNSRGVLAKEVCIFLCIFMAGSLWFQFCRMQQDPLVLKEGQQAEFSGIVRSVQKEQEGYRLIVQTGKYQRMVRYYGKTENLRKMAGKTVCLSGDVSLPSQRRNPGCFDYRLHLRACGIQVLIRADSIHAFGNREVLLLKLTSSVRCCFEEKLMRFTDPKTAGLAFAMIFGDKTSLDQDIYENFQRNGTAHILAVSGLHVGILYSFFIFFWRGKKGSFFHICIGSILLFYTALADFSPSVVRAAAMIGMHLLAFLLRRRYDLLSAAGASFLLMLIWNPFQLFHTGFQMSFLAVGSLGVILPYIKQFYKGVFLSSLAIQAGLFPYTAYVFNYISLGAFFANLPVVFLAGLLLPVGVVLIPASFVSDHLFSAGAWILQQGCQLLIRVNDLFYADGRTSFDIISPPLWLLICYYGLLFWAASEKGRILLHRKKKKEFFTAAALVILLSVGVAMQDTDGFSCAAITFVDVGQGDCIHVRTQDGKNYLFDGGGSINYDVGRKVLKPYLLKNGVRHIDAAFVTHLHEDHYGGIRSLAQEGMVRALGVYEANRLIENQLKKETGTDVFFLYKGQKLQLGDEVSVTILSPERKTEAEYESMMEKQEDENASSLIMKVEYKGIRLLITGDIDEEGEKKLLAVCREQLKCDILKIAHHGSKYSTSEEFLLAADPVLAVFQVGKNNFGHPSETVIEKCKQKGIIIVRNDTDGAAGICIKKTKGSSNGIFVQKMIE